MKYAKYLASQSIPEWSEYYFKYKKLKKELKALVRVSQAHPSEFSEAQQSYVELLYDELESINLFFEKKEKELQDQYAKLKTLLAESWQKETSKQTFFSFQTLTKRKGRRISPTIDTGLIRADSSPITPTIHESDVEKPVPISSEATLQARIPFPPPKLETSFNPPKSPQLSPIRDAEMPTPFVPHSQSKVPKGVTLARKYRFAVKRALEEVHRGLGMLKDYASLNSVGFRKIIKKHDKVPKIPSLVYFLEHEVNKSHFHTSSVPNDLMSEIESVYANLFTQGNVRQAADKLQIPNIQDQHDWVSFRFGLCMGAGAILALYLSGKSTDTTKDSPYAMYVMYAFRFLGIPVLWLWTFATAMLIWNSVRINYVFIFGWDPRKHMTPRNLYEIAAALSFLWIAIFTGYYNSQLRIHPFADIFGPIYPLVLISVVFTCIMLPFNVLYRSSRWWMFQTIWRILRTPFLPVKFKDFFYTNQFTSLKYSFSDMGDTLYFYLFAIWNDDTVESQAQWSRTALVYRPTLQAYPAVLRFLQCLRRYRDSKDRRHLINTGKYAFSVLTVVLSGTRKAFPTSITVICIYCIIASISTVYSWLWDTTMDWDLGYRKHKMLRGKLMYKRPWVYYLASIVDLLLRGVWAVTLGTTTHTAAFSNPMNTIAAVSEIMRRFIWNIFRLENEHLKNCHQSTATAVPALIAAYEQLNANLRSNAKSPSSTSTTSSNTTILTTDLKIPSLHFINNNNTPPTNNNNMLDYEMEIEDEEMEENVNVEYGDLELVSSEGIRHRHVSVVSEKE